jgi:uncharacterized protein YcbX
MAIAVCRLAVTAVKGTRLNEVPSVTLDRSGVRENRRFYVIDARDRMVNSKNLGLLQTIVAEYSDAERRLALHFPDGRVLEDEVRLGEAITTRFYSDEMVAHLVEGPWSAAVSEHVGKPLRLVESPDGAVDRGVVGAVSLISQASLARLASEADQDEVDPRRFRMLIEIDGVGAHEEDGWVGRRARIGQVTVQFGGHVGRCSITSRDPETGEVNLPTLDVLRSYRNGQRTTEPLAFGIYGHVLEGGQLNVGDAVELDGR